MLKQQPVDLKGRKEEHEDIITDEYLPEPKLISGTSPLPAVLNEDSDPISQFIEWPIIRPDGTHQPIQYRTAGHLLSSGVAPGNIQAASLIVMCMLSARLEYPISAMLEPEDAQAAVQLLDHCRKIVPEEAVIEFPELRPEHLYINGGRQLDGKCIIGPAGNSFSKALRDLELILTRGHTNRQEVAKGKYEVRLSEHRSAMRVSVVGIDGAKPGKGLSLPSVLKIPVGTNQGELLPASPEVFERYGLIHSPLFKIRKSFQRLKSQPVVIHYEKQLATALIESGCDHAFEKLAILKNLICLLAITSQPRPVQLAELGAIIYGTDESTVSRWLIDAGFAYRPQPISREPIIATKIDYYLARLLLDGILIAGPRRYSDRQRQVFETVKAINMGKMSTAIFSKGDDVEILANISRNSGCWATREKVFEEINKARDEYSLSSVNNDLVDLIEMGVLERAKPPKSRFYGYYVITTALSDAIQLPASETIQDPVYEGKTVNVVNPFTGDIDRI